MNLCGFSKKKIAIISVVMICIGVIVVVIVKNSESKNDGELYDFSKFSSNSSAVANVSKGNGMAENQNTGVDGSYQQGDGQIVDNTNVIYVHIAGEIKSPGVIELKNGSRIIDAIQMAGGLTDRANLNDVNLAYILEDGCKVYIPNVDEKESQIIITENGENIVSGATSAKGSKVNINTATQSELETLTGIGPSTAQKIIDYRNKNGKFNSIEDLKNVSGIGDSKFNQVCNEIVAK